MNETIGLQAANDFKNLLSHFPVSSKAPEAD